MIPVVSCSEGTKSPFSPVILHSLVCSAVLSREIIWKLSTYKMHLLKREGVIFRQTFFWQSSALELVSSNQEEKVGTWVRDKIMPKTASLWGKGVIYWRFCCFVFIWQNGFSWRKTTILLRKFQMNPFKTCHIQIQVSNFIYFCSAGKNSSKQSHSRMDTF